MTRSAILLFLLTILAGCSTHFSTLQTEGSTAQIIYAVSEEQAFLIAHGSLLAAIPGRKIEVIDGPVRGYSTYTRFVLDTYSQQVLVHAAQGRDALGNNIRGYYFEVSGSGTSGSGMAKNVELFEKLAESAKATGKGVAVTNVERIGYVNASWRLGEEKLGKSTPPAASVTNKEDVMNSLERLKDLRDRGVITEEEFESKKKEFLKRL